MENRIKEQQLQLFADRTSCHRWWPNQFRLLIASLAYTLIEAIRRLGLAGTGMARAQCATIRLKLLKIGAVIVRNTRRVRASTCHPQEFGPGLLRRGVSCFVPLEPRRGSGRRRGRWHEELAALRGLRTVKILTEPRSPTPSDRQGNSG